MRNGMCKCDVIYVYWDFIKCIHNECIYGMRKCIKWFVNQIGLLYDKWKNVFIKRFVMLDCCVYKGIVNNGCTEGCFVWMGMKWVEYCSTCLCARIETGKNENWDEWNRVMDKIVYICLTFLLYVRVMGKLRKMYGPPWSGYHRRSYPMGDKANEWL